MKWSRKFYFILGIFPFLFMEAMSNVPSNEPGDRYFPGMEEYTVCQEDSLIVEEKSLGQTSRKGAPSVKKNVSLLSFNFIYYVIYKFMYIEDIFDLNSRSANHQKLTKGTQS